LNGAFAVSGISGFSGFSGAKGDKGDSGEFGASGISGFSGRSGFSGAAFVGSTGASGFSGYSGQNGTIGVNGTSGFSGFSGQNGTIGINGTSGFSGFSGSSATFVPSTRYVFTSSQSTSILTATGALGGIELQATGSGAAFISYHRPGAFATYFGLDTDNQFTGGGWSYGGGLASFKMGSLGVGTSASGVAGEIRATNNITAFFSSDIRLKENIKNINNALEKVCQLNGVFFDWKEEELQKRGGEDGYFVRKHDVGVIAQEVEKVLPEIVATREDGIKAVRYELLVPLLLEAIKELKEQIKK